jgi:hypothetical protein
VDVSALQPAVNATAGVAAVLAGAWSAVIHPVGGSHGRPEALQDGSVVVLSRRPSPPGGSGARPGKRRRPDGSNGSGPGGGGGEGGGAADGDPSSSSDTDADAAAGGMFDRPPQQPQQPPTHMHHMHVTAIVRSSSRNPLDPASIELAPMCPHHARSWAFEPGGFEAQREWPPCCAGLALMMREPRKWDLVPAVGTGRGG